MIVLGVCALGVGCLYLVPGAGGSTGAQRANRPVRAGGAGSASPVLSTTTVAPPARSEPPTTRPNGDVPPGPAISTGARRSDERSTSRRTAGGATPVDPRTQADRQAPTAVTRLASSAVSRDRVTLSWAAAEDDGGVVDYQVWLNGFAVARTRATHATVRWFNDQAAHVVQVRAVDAQGNQSATSPTLVIDRPAPSSGAPAVTSTPRPSAHPSTTSPSPRSSTTPGPSESPRSPAASASSPTPASSASSASSALPPSTRAPAAGSSRVPPPAPRSPAPTARPSGSAGGDR